MKDISRVLAQWIERQGKRKVTVEQQEVGPDGEPIVRQMSPRDGEGEGDVPAFVAQVCTRLKCLTAPRVLFVSR